MSTFAPATIGLSSAESPVSSARRNVQRVTPPPWLAFTSATSCFASGAGFVRAFETESTTLPAPPAYVSSHTPTAADRRANAARTPRDDEQGSSKMSDDMKKIVDFVKNNPCVMAQVLLSMLALASPLYSVVLTLSRATLNAFALVLVLNIVVYLLSHFFVTRTRKRSRAVSPRPTCASPRRRVPRTQNRPTRATRSTPPSTRNSRATCLELLLSTTARFHGLPKNTSRRSRSTAPPRSRMPEQNLSPGSLHH